MKIRKVQRAKKFRTNVNRKRMNKRQNSTGNINCKPIKKAWDDKKSVAQNMTEMGLSHNPNKSIKIPNNRKNEMCKMKSIAKHGLIEDEDMESKGPTTFPKGQVAEALEEDAKTPRQKRFMLPKSQVKLVSYYLDKYNHDYKGMAKDKKNYNQETWKQIRKKIKKFMDIPKQYGEYLNSRGLLDKDIDEEKLMNDAKQMEMNDSD